MNFSIVLHHDHMSSQCETNNNIFRFFLSFMIKNEIVEIVQRFHFFLSFMIKNEIVELFHFSSFFLKIRPCLQMSIKHIKPWTRLAIKRLTKNSKKAEQE